MRLEKNKKDQMTPYERRRSIENGERADRVKVIPFADEFKGVLANISVWEFWHDIEKMVLSEQIAFNRYGYDRIIIGPNTRGISEALGSTYTYPSNGIPYANAPLIQDYNILKSIEPIDASSHPRIKTFSEEAKILNAEAEGIVPLSSSIGGPFTIASILRGVEQLLRDCRKYPQEVHLLMRIITDSQKSCINEAAKYGMEIDMADPVANPALIGPKMYREFVYPYTKELTNYAFQKTHRKVSLHMCGNTYSIWKYLGDYQLNELSLDNIIDLKCAAAEIGNSVPIAGNLDPVGIVMEGTKEEIFLDVKKCIDEGRHAAKGYTLATGCDIPETTDPRKVDWLMDAARDYGEYKE